MGDLRHHLRFKVLGSQALNEAKVSRPSTSSLISGEFLATFASNTDETSFFPALLYPVEANVSGDFSVKSMVFAHVHLRQANEAKSEYGVKTKGCE